MKSQKVHHAPHSKYLVSLEYKQLMLTNPLEHGLVWWIFSSVVKQYDIIKSEADDSVFYEYCSNTYIYWVV